MLKNPFTNRHNRYWKNRKINWKQAYCDPDNPIDTINHPHRELIINELKRIKWGSIIEIGCASGANLYKILRNFPHSHVGGVDINKDAINLAKELMPEADVLEVSSATKVFLSDKSVDLVLTDMALIYLDPFNINKAVKEIKRIARNGIILVEFHHKNWFKRQLLRFFGGYNSYNWEKLLNKHGFYDIKMVKLSDKDWPGGNPQKQFAWCITAKI